MIHRGAAQCRKSAMPKESSGLLLYRGTGDALEVLLAHPGGPFFTKKDEGTWTIPKGEIEPGEDALACAKRELQEEIGIVANATRYLALGSVRQKGGKTVHCWACEGDWDGTLVSNTFEMEWPPRSGKMRSFPEVDRAAFFSIAEARAKLNPAQAEFLARLLAALK
jgi:predicted NUDIX family NTP pyrophosphohydrolase